MKVVSEKVHYNISGQQSCSYLEIKSEGFVKRKHKHVLKMLNIHKNRRRSSIKVDVRNENEQQLNLSRMLYIRISKQTCHVVLF